jgi:hypothetical protein
MDSELRKLGETIDYLDKIDASRLTEARNLKREKKFLTAVAALRSVYNDAVWEADHEG